MARVGGAQHDRAIVMMRFRSPVDDSKGFVRHVALALAVAFLIGCSASRSSWASGAKDEIIDRHGDVLYSVEVHEGVEGNNGVYVYLRQGVTLEQAEGIFCSILDAAGVPGEYVGIWLEEGRGTQVYGYDIPCG